MIMTCSECGYYECGEGCIWQSRAPSDIPPCEEEDEDYTPSAEELDALYAEG